MGGKVLVPTQEAVNKLVAARLAADVCGVPTILVARTDAEASKLLALGQAQLLAGQTQGELPVEILRVERKPGGLWVGDTGLEPDRAVALRRDGAIEAAAELGVPFVVVDVSAPHETVRRRLDARTADASEADRAVLDYQHDHADPLDTARDGPIVPFVNREGADVDALVESITVTTGHR